MNRIDRALLVFVLTISVAIAYFGSNQKASAAPVNLSIQDALGALVPVMDSDNCVSKNMTALTPALVASGTAIHAASTDSKVVAVSVADDDAVAGSCSDCFFETDASPAAATGTGIHIPKGAVMPMRLAGDNAYLSASCVGACIVTMCKLN